MARGPEDQPPAREDERPRGRELVTPQSLGTYAGLSGGVVAIYQVFGGGHRWVAIAIAAFGALAFLALSPPLSEDRRLWARVTLWIFIFLANTAVLASAALGGQPVAEEVKKGVEQVI